MYKIKVLTHIIRLSDGHVMPSWEGPFFDEMEANAVSKALRNGELDSEGYAVRIRRSPKSNHAIDVELDNKELRFW